MLYNYTMVIRIRTAFFITLGLLGVWFLYTERAILTPFIIAAIFAYILNPVVNLFSLKFKFPRSLAILFIYCLMITFVALGSFAISSRLITESSELRNFLYTLLDNTKSQINQLPDFIRPTAGDFLQNFRHSRFLNLLDTSSFFPFFSQAISRVISFFIFVFSSYYFLREGGNIFDNLVNIVPNGYKVEVEILLRKINSVLGGYLRGELLLVFLMSVFTYIALTIIGLRFSLVVAIFSGFAEIVPVFGPITAGAVAIIVELVTAKANFGLTPTNTAIIIAGVYFVFRQLEDYFVIPHVMGKITKLHPFIIFFAVIAGGHIAGILGLILAVPSAAILKLLIEFFLDQINGKNEVASGRE